MWLEKLEDNEDCVFDFCTILKTFSIVIGAQIRIYHLSRFANTPIGVYFYTSRFEAKWKSSKNNEDLDTVVNTMAPTRFFDFSFSKRPSISYLLISGIVFSRVLSSLVVENFKKLLIWIFCIHPASIYV